MKSSRWVCPACSCLCDGLELAKDASNLQVVPDCSKANRWLADRQQTALLPAETEVVDKVRSGLASAKAPLITGIANLHVAAQQSCVKLAEKYSALLDVEVNHRGSFAIEGLQRYGKVTATFGEIANRADVVLIWCCDPAKSHPRFFERFLRDPSKPTKRIVVVDHARNGTSELADEFVEVADVEALVRQLRECAAGGCETKVDSTATGIFSQLIAAKYGTVILGGDCSRLATDAWYQLVDRLNDHTRFVMASLGNDRNGGGAEQVLGALCGFPHAIRFAGGRPMFNGSEYASGIVLDRHECDFLLVCDAGDDVPFETRLSKNQLDFLASIPVAVLSGFPRDKYRTIDHHLPVAISGWNCGGDFFRGDDIPIPLIPIETGELPEPRQLIEALY